MHQNSQSNLGEKISESFNAAHSHTLPPLEHQPTQAALGHTLFETPVCVFQVHEQRAEILLSLGTLAQDVRSARTLSQPGCGLTLLERLEHSINNYLHVVRLLHIEVRTTSSILCCSSDRYWHKDLRHAERLRGSWRIHSHRSRYWHAEWRMRA